MFSILPQKRTATAILRVRFGLNPRMDLVARVLFTLPGETHVSRAARNLFRCSCLRGKPFILSGLFPFADETGFACNCAQVQQKSLCRPMFFARLPNFVLPVRAITFGLHAQHVPCHVLTAPVFVLSQQEGSDEGNETGRYWGEREGHLFQVLRRGHETSDARTLTSSCWSSRSNNHD